MRTRLLALVTAIGLASLPTAATAQRTSLSIAGGLSAPTNGLADHVDAGFNLAAGLSITAPLSPVGLRLEAGWNQFNGRTTSLVSYTNTAVLTGTANVTVALGPNNASPYLIGGVGAYNRRFQADGNTGSDRTTAGFNVGGGVRFPLGTMSTFIEARYHQMLGNAADGTDYRFVPVTFGISF